MRAAFLQSLLTLVCQTSGLSQATCKGTIGHRIWTDLDKDNTVFTLV